MLESFIISGAILALGLFCISLRIAILKAKNEDLRLRLHLAEEIGSVMEKLKKNSNDDGSSFKGFFGSLLSISEDPNIIKNYIHFHTLFKQAESQSKATIDNSSHGVDSISSWLEENCSKEQKEQLQDIMALMVLCCLHASTYNLWRGRVFRHLFTEVVDAEEPAKEAAKREDFFHRPDTLSVFGKIFPDNLKTA